MATVLAGVLVLSILNLWLASKYRPVRGGRYLTIVQPTLWIGLSFLAVQIFRWRSRLLRAAALGGLASLFWINATAALRAEYVSPSYSSYRNRYAFAAAMNLVQSQKKPHDRVIYAAYSSYVHQRFGEYYGIEGEILSEKLEHRGTDNPQAPTALIRAQGGPLARCTWIIGLTPVGEKLKGTAEDPQAVLEMFGTQYGIAPERLQIPRPQSNQYVVLRLSQGRVKSWRFPHSMTADDLRDSTSPTSPDRR